MERLKIILGAVISVPPFSPGMAWNWMQHAQGLLRLGHDVIFVEEVEPSWCVSRDERPSDYESSVNRELFWETVRRFGLEERSFQILRGGAPLDSSVNSAIQGVDLLINMSGHVKSPAILEQAAHRVYFDQDPVYTQLWHAEYGEDLRFGDHDLFFSVGLNIGTSRSHIPDCGKRWCHALPVVIPECWSNPRSSSDSSFTTIASWSGYSDLQFEGRWYRSKYEEFRRFATLPREVGQPVEILLKAFRPEDEGVDLLRQGGWKVEMGDSKAGNLASYQAFIQGSRAEIGIAKNAYVAANSGWFSDRSAHYLASGRPVLAQSTGFESILPTGRGLLTFSTMEEAISGIGSINLHYEEHCRAAREFASEFLDYRKVLPAFLEDCLSKKSGEEE